MTSRALRTGRRHRGRELALRVLFELEGTDKDVEETLAYNAAELGAAPDVDAFGRVLVVGCLTAIDRIDEAIIAASVNWRLEDIGKVERAVLRLGAYELLDRAQTPIGVVIDEAVRLVKVYAGDDAGPFVNGVLGQIASGRP